MFKVDYPFKKEILACGMQSQANFCLTKKSCAFVVNNLGSLEEESAMKHYQSEIEQLRKELKIQPKVVTHDLHPGYSSTKYAQDLSRQIQGLTFVPVQHQKAHIASCIGENGIEDRVIGVVFDGGALGEDGKIWGGEFFLGDLKGLKRIAHFKYTPIPDGKENHLESSELAASFLYQAFGDNFLELEIDFMRYRRQNDWQAFKEKLVHLPHSSSVAKIFDGVSALLGGPPKLVYEGHGVVELERIVNRSSHVAGRTYEFQLKRTEDIFLICPEPIIQGVVEDLKKNISRSIISAVFHNTLVEIVRQLCRKIKQQEKVNDVILTGAVFQNKVLFNRLKALLSQDGFRVITHKHFSCNDSNISFGQAVLASRK